MSEVINNFFEEVKIKTTPKLITLSNKHNFEFIRFEGENVILETKGENIYRFSFTFSDKSYYKKLQVLEKFKNFLDTYNFKIYSYHASRKGQIICPYNHEPFSVLPGVIMDGDSPHFDDGCKTCYQKGNTRRIKRDFEIFKKEVELRNGTVLGTKYYTEASKILVKCNVCEREWETCMTYLKDNGWCYDCRTGTTESRKKFKELTEKEGYTVLDEYKIVTDNVRMICPKGHQINKSVVHFLSGTRCKICLGLCPIEAANQFYEILTKKRR